MNAFRRLNVTVASDDRIDTPVLRGISRAAAAAASCERRLTDSIANTVSISRSDLFASQHRRREIAGLVDHFRARHRIARRAAHRCNALRQARFRRQARSRRSRRAPAGAWRVPHHAPGSPCARSRSAAGVLHTRLVMRAVEGNGLVEQHDGDHVLQADVGDIAVVHHRGDRRCKAHGHALDLIGFERLFCRGSPRSPSSGAWIGEPTVHFLMSVCAIS